MATTEELKRIARMCFDNDSFQTSLKKDPLQAAASIGITLSKEQADSLNGNLISAETPDIREAKSIFFPFRL